jgi:hypothetical protein
MLYSLVKKQLSNFYDKEKNMTKKMIIKEIIRMTKECHNMQLLHLIYLTLLKADKIDLTTYKQ